MSLCNTSIPLLTSLEQLRGFASNLVWMFLGWTPTKFVKITDQKSFIYLVWKVPRDLFLVYSVPIFTLLINDLCLTHF